MSRVQHTPFGEQNDQSDNNDIPGWEHETLSIKLKYTDRNRLDKTLFLADRDLFNSQSKTLKTSDESFLKKKPLHTHKQKDISRSQKVDRLKKSESFK